MRTIILMAVIYLIWPVNAGFTQQKSTEVNVERLAGAIYLAEGGSGTRHPYGILAHYKHTTPRQACINTIKSGLRRYSVYKGNDDFITFLGRTYCPLNDPRDKTRLNKNWISNVRYYYNQGGK